jgi:hypothetical protein
MTENSEKTKISKHAIASFILGLASSVIVFALSLFLGDACLGSLLALAGIITGIVALVKIHRSRGLLKGRLLAIIGIFAALIGPILGVYASGIIFFQARDNLWRQMCQQNLTELAKVLEKYTNEYGGQYPPTDQWCDIIVNLRRQMRQQNLTDIAKVLEKYHGKYRGQYPPADQWSDKIVNYSKSDMLILNCPCNKKARSSYTINPNCEPNSPGDMVLLFEGKDGWNQSGGPELLTTENHQAKGSNILFNNGTVRFITTEELQTLKWKP